MCGYLICVSLTRSTDGSTMTTDDDDDDDGPLPLPRRHTSDGGCTDGPDKAVDTESGVEQLALHAWLPAWLPACPAHVWGVRGDWWRRAWPFQVAGQQQGDPVGLLLHH